MPQVDLYVNNWAVQNYLLRILFCLLRLSLKFVHHKIMGFYDEQILHVAFVAPGGLNLDGQFH